MTADPHGVIVVRPGEIFRCRFGFLKSAAVVAAAMLFAAGYRWPGTAASQDDDVKLIREAAEQGVAVARSALAVMYASGRGMEKNDALAAQWYRLAAEQGDPKAQHNLALMYMTGRGVTRDDAQATEWYRRAAEQGIRGPRTTLP